MLKITITMRGNTPQAIVEGLHKGAHVYEALPIVEGRLTKGALEKVMAEAVKASTRALGSVVAK